MLKPAPKKYREAVDYLVSNYYPELKDKRIHLLQRNLKIFWASAVWILPFRVIFVSPKIDVLDDKPLYGLLGHELAHLSIYNEKGWFKYLYTYPYVYLFSKQGIIKEENTVDKLTIKKGLGEALFELRHVVKQDKKHARVNYLYLTEEEILNYDRSNDKW
jgi:hypothetical protein